ncbi:hypothetical protein QE152_g15811 [Popillia japonica]|uniref:DDE Tnp4 domain-containing protein n=1 Tax=Popillia japonica TaxID=7064 RepID=A0AAW1L4S9_POPJA
MYSNQERVCLLGDSGYAVTPWMLTPFQNPATNIERYFMLNYTVRLKTDRICRYIMCGFILHNCAKFLNDAYEHFQEIDVEEEPVMPALYAEPNNAAIRRRGIQFRNEIAELMYRQR